MSRPVLCVSVSGGKTSAYMVWLLLTYFSEAYRLVFVFANTGEENEETLLFVKRLAEHFNINIAWVEASVYHNERKSTGHRVVNFETAARSGVDGPFEQVIIKYGIPNQNFPQCTRELKLNPIRSYMKSLGFERSDYWTALGIRTDERGRERDDRDAARIIYPLIYFMPTDKADVNDFWEAMPFNLNLLEHQGNCRTCWKKSFKKLYRIIDENPEYFEFNRQMETRHFAAGAGYQPDAFGGRGRRFFRTGLSVEELFALRHETGPLPMNASEPDDSGGCGESCDINAEVGIDEDDS